MNVDYDRRRAIPLAPPYYIATMKGKYCTAKHLFPVTDPIFQGTFGIFAF